MVSARTIRRSQNNSTSSEESAKKKTICKIEKKIRYIDLKLSELRAHRRLNKFVYVNPSDGIIYTKDEIQQCRGHKNKYKKVRKIIPKYKDAKKSLYEDLRHYNKLENGIQDVHEQLNSLIGHSRTPEQDEYRDVWIKFSYLLLEKRYKFQDSIKNMHKYEI